MAAVARANFSRFLQVVPDLELRIKAIADMRSKQYEVMQQYTAAATAFVRCGVWRSGGGKVVGRRREAAGRQWAGGGKAAGSNW